MENQQTIYSYIVHMQKRYRWSNKIDTFKIEIHNCKIEIDTYGIKICTCEIKIDTFGIEIGTLGVEII